ncbi:hypothetical protein GA0074695_5090 [Micromonospora viridifaciens]|uniref:Uncharacterized protein n=1 Tax=Micromonospora viridifaciens TaxID=1881 RepID=A0A1C4Z4D8_MICVI|nr:hypothetical protein [Micromonospora viridifaciens]SCF27838.1 hypothetical protein GA0074695_5090 [Micromonospora viridifaciens]
MTRSSVPRRILVWLVGSALGGLLLALPDSGPRLFSFSRTHGPSLVDLLGMVIAVVAWLPVVWLIWRHRSALRDRTGRLAAGLALVGVVLLAVTIRADLGLWWLLPVAMLVAAQLMALASIARRPTGGGAGGAPAPG